MNELSYAVASAPPGNWNVLAAGADQQGLTPVADQVWPSVFTFGPDFNPVLNSALVQSATQISQSPQTIVYQINPKASWSDGTPVTGADFVYNWQAQSGKPGNADLGGKAFTPSSTAGYSSVQSVTVSAGSPDTVTVVFATPDPDWTQLFRHLVPAHVAQRVGFDTGFTDPVSDLVSDGPYLVGSYDPSGIVHLVRNPSYSGAPAAALELDVHYLPDTDQLATGLSDGQISCADIPGASVPLSTLKAANNLTVSVSPSSTFVDLLFNAGGGPMSSSDARAAVTTAIASTAVIPDALKAELQGTTIRNRFLVPGETGYTANPPPASPPPQRAPTSTTRPTSMRLAVASTDPVAVSTAQAVAAQLDAAGFAVTVSRVSDASKLSTPSWDLAVVLRQLTPWPIDAVASYESGKATNLGRLSDQAADTVIQSAIAAPASQEKAMIDQVDEAVWDAYADVPLFALPEVLACQTNVTGAAPNASPDGPAYNAASWGLRGGSS